MTKEKAILWFFVLFLASMAVFGIYAAFQGHWVWWTIAAVCLLIPLGFLVVGLRVVRPEERFVIELLGSFHGIKKSGLVWICPILMQVRAITGTWQQTVALFEEPIKIDFRDGSATPKGAEVFVKIRDPDTLYDAGGERHTGVYRTIYKVKNWREALRDLIENFVRSYLNSLTIDEGITKKKAGFDLRNSFPKKERERMEDSLAIWGLELLQVTVQDFDLDPEIVQARGEVQKRIREAEAAGHEKRIRAFETMGALIQMIAEAMGMSYEEVQAEVRSNTEMGSRLKNFAENLITRRMSIDGKALTDVRVDSGGDLAPLLALIAAAKQIPGGGSSEGGKA